MRSYFHKATCILPLVCSGRQPDDGPMGSKHITELIILNLCLMVICLFLISVQIVRDNECETVVHDQSRGSDNYQM